MNQRIRQTVTGTTPITIYYAGAVEKEVAGSGTTVKTRMPGGIGYLSDTTGDTAVRYRYLRGDHLGSTVVVTDDTGAVLDRDSYDPWGQRRNTDGSDDPTSNLRGYDRIGYTGEEMLDTVGLVHLNGRVYDPLLGRFLSADPTIPDLNDSQSLNRYAYVRNNPLNAIDPTGFDQVEKGGVVEVYGCKACERTDALNDALAQLNANSHNGVRYNIVRVIRTGQVFLARAVPAAMKREARTQLAAGASLVIPGVGEFLAPLIEVGGQIYIIAALVKDLAGGSLVFSEGANSAPPIPDDYVGDQSRGKTSDSGKRHLSGPLTPENGGTGVAGRDFDTLTGGTGQPFPDSDSRSGKPGALVGDNGIWIRPGTKNPGDGPRIEIPGNGDKLPETLHY